MPTPRLDGKRTGRDLLIFILMINPLMHTSNYSATSNNMKLVRWPLMGALLIWYGKERTG